MAATNGTGRKRGVKPFNPGMYIDLYELSKSGHTVGTASKIMGVPEMTLRDWLKRDPYLMEAFKRGRPAVVRTVGERTDLDEAMDYVYDCLPINLKPLWEQLVLIDKAGSGVDRAEALLSGFGKKARQLLFLKALVHFHFNASLACKMVGIKRTALDHWVYDDPHFAQLMDEMRWHLGNKFEAALVRLVDAGDPSAVIFVNKTFNRNRGYNDKQEIDVRYSGQVGHAVVDVDKLGLSLEQKKDLLDKIRSSAGKEPPREVRALPEGKR